VSVIVVGVDGSDGARDALHWAAEEARMRGAGLRAVHAWQVPVAVYSGGGFGPVAAPDWSDDLEKAARVGLARWLEAAADDLRGVDVEQRVEAGPAAAVLSDAAADADLLVVGSRGLGGFKELMLGSVSHQCAQHAPCPVVVVRGSRRG
jgi:nucleotide-binding universal stress UspA family protein